MKLFFSHFRPIGSADRWKYVTNNGSVYPYNLNQKSLVKLKALLCNFLFDPSPRQTLRLKHAMSTGIKMICCLSAVFSDLYCMVHRTS